MVWFLLNWRDFSDLLLSINKDSATRCIFRPYGGHSNTVTGLANFGFTPLLWRPPGPPGVSRVESQYKNFWQNLVATFYPLYTCEKGPKCGDQVLSKNFVLWFYSSGYVHISKLFIYDRQKHTQNHKWPLKRIKLNEKKYIVGWIVWL